MKFIEVETENGSVKYWLNPDEIKTVTRWADRQLSVCLKDGSSMSFLEGSQSARNIMEAIGASEQPTYKAIPDGSGDYVPYKAVQVMPDGTCRDVDPYGTEIKINQQVELDFFGDP